MPKPTKKLAFIDGAGFIKNKIFALLGDKYDFIIDENSPDYVFYSVFSEKHIEYDCVRIFITGENCRTDFNFADYGISFDYLDFGSRHLRYPLYLLAPSFELCLSRQVYDKSALKEPFKRNFCSFVVSNGKAHSIRDEVFSALNAYKKVDSGGRYRNNIGAPVGDKLGFLSRYKFNIACENSSTQGYITEKIFDSKAAHSIPIYFGDRDIAKALSNGGGGGINEKAFINVHNFKNLSELVAFVKFLDNDENAYMAMLNAPLIMDSNHLAIFDARLKAFLENIFDKPLESAFERGFSQWRMNLENRYKKYQKARKLANALPNALKRIKKSIKKPFRG